jgi:hypothetical protein
MNIVHFMMFASEYGLSVTHFWRQIILVISPSNSMVSSGLFCELLVLRLQLYSKRGLWQLW